MEFMDWDGYRAFLSGDEEDEFYHIVFSEAPDYGRVRSGGVRFL